MLQPKYKDDVFSGNRKYQQVNNKDGTISLVDVTEYEQVGTTLNAEELNGLVNDVNSAIASVTKPKIYQITPTWSNKQYQYTIPNYTSDMFVEVKAPTKTDVEKYNDNGISFTQNNEVITFTCESETDINLIVKVENCEVGS